MSKYKLEMHFHTSETSPCGEVGGKDGAELYKKAGYDGVVVTDHFFKNSLGTREESKYTWEEVIEKFLVGYKAAKEAETEEFRVILGMEIRFTNAGNDFLVYGVTEEFLKENPWIHCETLEYLYNISDKYNLIIAQAHAFREKCYFAPAEFMHGLEVFNGNPDHDSRNKLAEKAAEIYNLIEIKGSDFHEEIGISHNHFLVDELPRDSQDLVNIIKKQNPTKLR